MCLLDLLLLSLFSNTDKISVALPVLPLLKTTTFFKILSCQMHNIKHIFGQDHKLLWCVRAKLVTVSQVYIKNLLNYTKTGVKRVEKLDLSYNTVPCVTTVWLSERSECELFMNSCLRSF